MSVLNITNTGTKATEVYVIGDVGDDERVVAEREGIERRRVRRDDGGAHRGRLRDPLQARDDGRRRRGRSSPSPRARASSARQRRTRPSRPTRTTSPPRSTTRSRPPRRSSPPSRPATSRRRRSSTPPRASGGSRSSRSRRASATSTRRSTCARPTWRTATPGRAGTRSRRRSGRPGRPRTWARSATSSSPTSSELRRLVPTAEITPTSMANGAKELLDEVASGKITGEEEAFSHTDLVDFKANLDGAKKVFDLLKPALEKKDQSLVHHADRGVRRRRGGPGEVRGGRRLRLVREGHRGRAQGR